MKLTAVIIIIFCTLSNSEKSSSSKDRLQSRLHNKLGDEPLNKIGTSLRPTESNTRRRRIIPNLPDDSDNNDNNNKSNSDRLDQQSNIPDDAYTQRRHYDRDFFPDSNGNSNSNAIEHKPSTTSKNIHPSNVHPLVRKASSASLSLVYLLLAWRAMGSYDSSAQFSTSLLRTVSNIPVAGIFILDILGLIISIINPSKLKVQLKFILACNTVREIIELTYNVIMIIISTSVSNFNRDYYFGRLITSVYFLMLCISTSRIRWTEQKNKTI
jgi:hypothetical protein